MFLDSTVLECGWWNVIHDRYSLEMRISVETLNNKVLNVNTEQADEFKGKPTNCLEHWAQV